MRYTILFAVLLLAGCASQLSLEELEDKALATGDWTAVENREGMLKRRMAENSRSCPANQTKVCVEQGADIDCFCVHPAGRN